MNVDRNHLQREVRDDYLGLFTIATLPIATSYEGKRCRLSDSFPRFMEVFSDGTVWRSTGTLQAIYENRRGAHLGRYSPDSLPPAKLNSGNRCHVSNGDSCFMELYSDGMGWRFSASHLPLANSRLSEISDPRELPATVPAPPLPSVRLPKVLDRLLRAIWSTADWTASPPQAKAIAVVVEVWKDEEKLSTNLRPTISRLNDAFLCAEPRVDLNITTKGDWILMEGRLSG